MAVTSAPRDMWGPAAPDFWPTVAVICDLLTERGMWSEVHAWRS